MTEGRCEGKKVRTKQGEKEERCQGRKVSMKEGEKDRNDQRS